MNWFESFFPLFPPECPPDTPVLARSPEEIATIRRVTARLKNHTSGYWIGLLGASGKELNTPGYERKYVGESFDDVNDIGTVEFNSLCVMVTVTGTALFQNNKMISSFPIDPVTVEPGYDFLISNINVQLSL